MVLRAVGPPNGQTAASGGSPAARIQDTTWQGVLRVERNRPVSRFPLVEVLQSYTCFRGANRIGSEKTFWKDEMHPCRSEPHAISLYRQAGQLPEHTVVRTGV
ncbi:hypothetical protein DSM19430T_25100 [Desulfovibrio psychrotolerans]|uniref:Uncharacterized protein n=1 Tax=Desulfovibrio psychrotolerans TaxID=415242 RepID=A0A7J0BVT1_9BACT|nr:hypothetical protein DSM19430T_25100 [Desulfovibrio psychrotolerans]